MPNFIECFTYIQENISNYQIHQESLGLKPDWLGARLLARKKTKHFIKYESFRNFSADKK